MAPASLVVRHSETFQSDDRRVILRFLSYAHPPRIRSIVRRVLKLPEDKVAGLVDEVMKSFRHRHRDIHAALVEHYGRIARHIRPAMEISEARQLLIGAYFTLEYSIESAALFNPSIVPHPDQSDLPEGSVRILLSMRATGEGHISSIVFRRGTIDSTGTLRFDPPPRFAFTTRPAPDARYDKALLVAKFRDTGLFEGPLKGVIDHLGAHFSLSELRAALHQAQPQSQTPVAFREAAAKVMWLARANYTLVYPSDCLPAEIVLFPATEHEQNGLEDLRLVRFIDDDGQATYYGTYTAYDGTRIHPMLLETTDFHTFHVSTPVGRYVKNKGMALFPRKMGGQYLMLSRHDGESLFLLRARSLHYWNVSQKLQVPREPWELLQIGNCGSPLETEAGWIVLTHGVGPLRKYCIGAMLLDRADPSRVIGRLRQPLLAPTDEEREGYVPNVLYTCGSMVHRDQLFIPYAISDKRTAFATVPIGPLIDALRRSGR